MSKYFQRVEVATLPPLSTCDQEAVYVLMPNISSKTSYEERVNRNIGWITPEEQEILHGSVVSIAGCGGMGGLVAAGLLRLGVGEIRLADPETFDLSNLNRQFAAKSRTVGVNKALATAEELRLIMDDTRVVVYPMGINDRTVDEFVEGSDLICDLIEFWVVSERIRVHEHARRQGVSLMVCNTVGHRTNLFLYTPTSMTMEEALGIDLQKAEALRGTSGRKLSEEERSLIMERMIRAVIPDGLPEYVDASKSSYSTREAFLKRLANEMTASIVATNPVMAAGFMLNRILFELLRKSPVRRISQTITPPMPGYLSFDAATMESKTVTSQWW